MLQVMVFQLMNVYKTEIDHCSQMYGQEVGMMTAIQEMFKKAIENSDNKVQMATADV